MKPAQFVEVPTLHGKVYVEISPDLATQRELFELAIREFYQIARQPGGLFNIVPNPVLTDKLEAENMKLRGEIARLEMILTTTAERVSDLSSDLTEFMPWGDMDDRDDD